MALINLFESITSSTPFRKLVDAPNSCGKLVLTLDDDWTSTMREELPEIEFKIIYNGKTYGKIILYTDSNTEMKIFSIPENFYFEITPKVVSGASTDEFLVSVDFDNAPQSGGGGGGGIDFDIDSYVTEGSDHLVTSGGIYNYGQDVKTSAVNSSKSYTDSQIASVSIPVATKETAGKIIVGDSLNVTNDGTTYFDPPVLTQEQYDALEEKVSKLYFIIGETQSTRRLESISDVVIRREEINDIFDEREEFVEDEYETGLEDKEIENDYVE